MEEKSRHSIYCSNAIWNALIRRADDEGVSISTLIERILLKEFHATLDDLVDKRKDTESECIRRILSSSKKEGKKVTIAPICLICRIPHRCKTCGYVGYLGEYSVKGVLCVACNQPIRCLRPIIIE